MTPEQFKDAVDQINRNWTEMKAALAQADAERKARGEAHPETAAKIDAINARIDQLEVSLKRPGAGAETKADDNKDARERKAAYGKFLRKGHEAMTPDERKFLSISDDTTGGFLANDDVLQEIIKGVTEISPMRRLARIRTTSQRAVKVRKRTQKAAAVWIGAERVTKTETQGPKYGLEEVPNHELYAMHDISNQDLEDSAFDLESELGMEWSEQFGVSEAVAFVSGNGVGQPEGLLATGTGIAEIKSGHASTLTYDGLVDLIHGLKSSYARNAVLALNRLTLGAIRKMKDGQGQPLWAPMMGDAPATILGARYEEFPDMPDVGAGNVPIVYGDFRRGYLIVDRLQVSTLRDPYSQATEGAVRFIARKRVGGQVLLAEALKKHKIAA